MQRAGSGDRLVQTFTADHEHSYISDPTVLRRCCRRCCDWVEQRRQADAGVDRASLPGARGARSAPVAASGPTTGRRRSTAASPRERRSKRSEARRGRRVCNSPVGGSRRALRYGRPIEQRPSMRSQSPRRAVPAAPGAPCCRNAAARKEIDVDSRHLQLDDPLYSYLLDHSVREHPAQTALRAATRSPPHAGMQISPEQGQFMALLVQADRRAPHARGRRVHRLQRAGGGAGAAGRRPRCWPATSATSTPASAGRYWQQAGVAHKIDLQLAPGDRTRSTRALAAARPAATTSRSSTPTRPSYDAYYERCLQLVRPGGLIAIDNVLWGGNVAHPGRQDADTARCRRSTRSCTATSASTCRCCRSATA